MEGHGDVEARDGVPVVTERRRRDVHRGGLRGPRQRPCERHRDCRCGLVRRRLRHAIHGRTKDGTCVQHRVSLRHRPATERLGRGDGCGCRRRVLRPQGQRRWQVAVDDGRERVRRRRTEPRPADVYCSVPVDASAAGALSMPATRTDASTPAMEPVSLMALVLLLLLFFRLFPTWCAPLRTTPCLHAMHASASWAGTSDPDDSDHRGRLQDLSPGTVALIGHPSVSQVRGTSREPGSRNLPQLRAC